jgi:hypothetical protein
LRRLAWLPDQSFEAMVKLIELSEKSARTVGLLTERLDQHRGRGQQQITVKHVTVNADQALVADTINTGKQSQNSPARPAGKLLTTGKQKAMEILEGDLVREGGDNERGASTPCKALTRPLGAGLNQNVLVSPAGPRQFEAVASAGCMAQAAVVRQGEETETIDMAVGRKELPMPSATLTRWRKMLAIAEAHGRRPECLGRIVMPTEHAGQRAAANGELTARLRCHWHQRTLYRRVARLAELGDTGRSAGACSNSSGSRFKAGEPRRRAAQGAASGAERPAQLRRTQ